MLRFTLKASGLQPIENHAACMTFGLTRTRRSAVAVVVKCSPDREAAQGPARVLIVFDSNFCRGLLRLRGRAGRPVSFDIKKGLSTPVYCWSLLAILAHVPELILRHCMLPSKPSDRGRNRDHRKRCQILLSALAFGCAQ